MAILFFKWILFSLIIILVSWLVPGLEVENFLTAMLVSVIMACLNIFVKPILILVTLPVNIITLGLFSFVINAFMLILAGYIAPGFEVEGFFSALFGSIILSFFSVVIARL